jgi:hypothetical protein
MKGVYAILSLAWLCYFVFGGVLFLLSAVNGHDHSTWVTANSGWILLLTVSSIPGYFIFTTEYFR